MYFLISYYPYSLYHITGPLSEGMAIGKKKLELERLPANKRLSSCFHNLGKALVDVGNSLEYLLTCFFIIMQRPA